MLEKLFRFIRCLALRWQPVLAFILTTLIFASKIWEWSHNGFWAWIRAVGDQSYSVIGDWIVTVWGLIL